MTPTVSSTARRRRGQATPPLQGSRATEPATVVFGDVIGSRRYRGGAAGWLDTLAEALDGRYGEQRLAPFDFTQGDELQGLLRPDADPFEAVLVASLSAGAPKMRWVIVAGDVEPGEGHATRRSGPAFITARATIGQARQQRDGLLVITGDPHADTLLAGTAPVLAELLDRLTERQQEVARRILLEGRTQADVAEALGVTRATISVSYQRAGLRSITRLLAVVRQLFREGAQVARAAATVVS
jgi:hypothetical protein